MAPDNAKYIQEQIDVLKKQRSSILRNPSSVGTCWTRVYEWECVLWRRCLLDFSSVRPSWLCAVSSRGAVRGHPRPV